MAIYDWDTRVAISALILEISPHRSLTLKFDCHTRGAISATVFEVGQ
jgi:hypothetical protein